MATQQMTVLQQLQNTTLSVQNQIDKYCKEGKLNLPQNYSAGNAIKQAQLKIQDDAKLMACTQASIAKAMLDMCILGLTVGKQQCYFVPFGTQAQLSVSYMGKVAIAKRVDPEIKEIFGRVVKKGEEFEFNDSLDGTTTIIKHKRTLDSLNSKEILAAYATIVYNDDRPPCSTIMTFDRIKKSWAQSAMHPVDSAGNIKDGTTHAKFTEDMAIKTVISAACKMIINTSSDADLFAETVQQNELNETKMYADIEASEKMSSGDIVDIDEEDIREVEDEPQEKNQENLE